MKDMAKNISILNLTGELSAELTDYFARKNLRIVDPLAEDTKLKWTHIFTKELHDFRRFKDLYGTVLNDIKVISLSPVNDVQNFVMANGKLIFDEAWMKSSLGDFILDKFFQEYGGIAISDNYPSFKEKGSFKVINPFNTGEYLDQMVHHAFSGGVEALSVKTFFDHLLMFLAGLKRKSKIGYPIEVTYGALDDVFGVQVHFFTERLLLEDVTACLSNEITSEAEKYLLNVAVKSTDFFDFSFLSKVKKAVITGLWTNDEMIHLEGQGMMFANLSATSTLIHYPSEGVTSSLIPGGEISDQSDKILLPDHPDTAEEGIRIPGRKFTEALAQRISTSIDLDKIKQILNGEVDIEKLPEFLNDRLETEDGKVILRSLDEMDEAMKVVKGKFEEENEIIRVSGGPFNPDNVAMRVSSSLIERADEAGSMRLKALGSKLPDTIKTGLFDFAMRLGKKVESLDIGDLESFQKNEVPALIMTCTEIMSDTTISLLKDFRTNFEQSLKSEFNVDSAEVVIDVIRTEDEEYRVKSLLKDTLRDTLDDNFRLSQKNAITKVEQEVLVKSLSLSLEEDESKIRAIVMDEELLEGEENPLFAAAASEQFDEKARLALEENEQLKQKMKVLAGELRFLQEMNQKLTRVGEEARESAEREVQLASEEDEALRAHFLKKLSQQQGITEHEQLKLSSLLERETKYLAEAQKMEIKSKKQILEMSQKETLLMKELEKASRLVKGRDLMLVKAKEAFVKMNEKKDAEVADLQNKIGLMAKSLASGPTQTQATAIRDLEKQNQNLSKMLEVYKVKVSSLASNMQTSRNEDDSNREEVRRAQMLNNQLKNQLDYSKKELSKLYEKSAEDTTHLNALKQDKARLEQLLKKALSDEKVVKEVASPPAQTTELEQSFKRLMSQNQQLEASLRDSSARMKELEAKLAEAPKAATKGSSSPDDASKVKVGQLEASMKKLTQDLNESKNQLNEMKKETNKLRQEKTSLQNQLDKIKKDSEKSEKKKPSGGKAA